VSEDLSIGSAVIEALRRITSAGSAQYTLDGTPFWTDEQLAEVLERHVPMRLLQAPIEMIETLDAESGIVFVNGRAPALGMLDTENVVVTAWTGAALLGEATVHSDGRVEFTHDQATAVPVISGLCYDLFGAGAEVVTSWAGALSEGADFTIDGQSLSRSQKHAQLLAQTETLRARAVAGTVQMRRGDGRGGNGTRRSDAVRRSFARLGRPGR
jgi:hypothetical protein